MRIRKVLRRSPLLTRGPSRFSNNDKQTKWQPAQPDLAKPSAASSLHPDAFYAFLGLYKYGTGLFHLSSKFRDRIHSPTASLKVYSNEPLPQQDVKQALRVGLDTCGPSTNPRSALSQLFHISSKVLSSSSKIINVHFQIFERYSSRADRNRTTSFSRNKAWSLFCQLYKYDSGPSKPWHCLAMSGIYVDRRCKIRGRPALNKQLKLVLSFTAKPSTIGMDGSSRLQTNGSDPHAQAGPIQPLIDQMLEQMLRSVRDKEFVHENAMLLTIEREMLVYLRSSPLAPLVDFRNLLLELQNMHEKNKERIVTNIMLNADGTPSDGKADLEDTREMYGTMSARLQERQISTRQDLSATPQLSTTASPAQDIGTTFQQQPTIFRDTPFQLSKASQAKAGVRELRKAVIRLRKDGTRYRVQVSPTEILEVFDSLCASAPANGLAGLSYATALLASKFPDFDAWLETCPIPIVLTPPTVRITHAHMSVRSEIENGLAAFSITLPRLQDLDSSVGQTPLRITSCRVTLVGKYYEHVAQQTALVPNISTNDEGNLLTQMVTTVVEGLLKGVTFDTCEAVPYLLAEGLLRSLQFLSSGLLLQGVRIIVKLPAESPVGLCEIKGEKWKDADVDSRVEEATSNVDRPIIHGKILGNIERYGNMLNVAEEPDNQSIAETAYSPAEILDAEHDITAKNSYDDPSKVPRSAGMTVLNSEATRAFRPAYGETTEDLWGPRVSVSPTIQQRFGLSLMNFAVLWNARTTRFPAGLTFDTIQTCLISVLESMPMANLQAVHHAVRTVFEETIPTRTMLNFEIAVDPHRLPDDLQITLNDDNRFLVCFYFRKAPYDTRKVEHIIVVPGIHGFAVRIQRPLSTSQIFLNIALYGVMVEGENGAASMNVPSQFGHILRTINNIVKPPLSSRSFRNMYDVASEVASTIMEHNGMLSSIIHISEVKASAVAKYQDKDGKWVQLAKGRSSSTRGVNAKTEVPTSANDGEEVPLPSPEKPVNTETEEHEQDTNQEPLSKNDDLSSAFIALGSNQGNRLQNIENACAEINSVPDTRILRTSALYETAPMYVEDQDPFLNGVCQIETNLSPVRLLDELQAIEKRLGRVKTIEKGPRNIDLDILLYGNEKVQTQRLTIPHPLMLEREFVLRPLCSIQGARSKRHPGTPTRYSRLLEKLMNYHLKPTMYALTNLAPGAGDIHVGSPRERTRIMSIINVTPDSFSDGGLHSPTNLKQLKSSIRSQILSGATVIDIGGQSSRPNAPDVTVEEELSRILPAIETIRSIPEAANVAISVDTYRATVAEAAINAGAHIINDISAGLLDEEMLPTIARLGCTYIMMHMRGTPSTMMSAENCSYPHGLIPTIKAELAQRVQAAEAAGIYRWRIILDPGIGFSKTAEQNLEVLRHLSQFTNRSYAWLVGSSRKSFIGKITGVGEPKERGWGTAATVTAAIQGGADIVRVHDAREMEAVVKMADAMYRVQS